MSYEPSIDVCVSVNVGTMRVADNQWQLVSPWQFNNFAKPNYVELWKCQEL